MNDTGRLLPLAAFARYRVKLFDNVGRDTNLYDVDRVFFGEPVLDKV
jgi:hypothetical protein